MGPTRAPCVVYYLFTGKVRGPRTHPPESPGDTLSTPAAPTSSWGVPGPNSVGKKEKTRCPPGRSSSGGSRRPRLSSTLSTATKVGAGSSVPGHEGSLGTGSSEDPTALLSGGTLPSHQPQTGPVRGRVTVKDRGRPRLDHKDVGSRYGPRTGTIPCSLGLFFDTGSNGKCFWSELKGKMSVPNKKGPVIPL